MSLLDYFPLIIEFLDIEINLENIGEIVMYNEISGELKKNIINCAICSESYNENSKILITKCYHNFCYDCINTWINKEIKNNCPMCRKCFISEEIFENVI